MVNYVEGEFIEVTPEIQNDLDELKKTLRLLPFEKRKKLMDFVVTERNYGAVYLRKGIMESLTSAYVLCTGRHTVFFDSNKESSDLRKLPDIDANYPLYTECKKGATKQIYDQIFYYSKILYDLKGSDMESFVQEVCLPDTKIERQQKKERYDRIKKQALAKHNERYQKDKMYKLMIDYEKDSKKQLSFVNGPVSTNRMVAIGVVFACMLGGLLKGCSENKNDNKQYSAPKVQKITDQKKLSVQDTSRGVREN